MLAIQKDSWQSEVLDSATPVLVDFWAEWCGPCRALTPILEELANEFNDQVKIVKVNVDENPELASEFGIRSIPTLLLFQGGELRDQIVGVLPKPQLKAKLEEFTA